MAELLVKAKHYTHPDSDKDKRGAYKKGDIVVIVEDDHTWGSAEGPPTFVIIKVPGITTESIKDKRDSLESIIDYTIINNNTTLDAYRIKLFEAYPGAAEEYNLTGARVQEYIEEWGGTVFSTGTNEVIFDILVEDAYMSKGFWDTDPATLDINITEISYVEATGIHTATIDVSLSKITTEKAQATIEAKGGIVTGITGDTLTAEFTRTDVRDIFVSNIAGAAKVTHIRRRWYFAEADVDTALAAGGTITVTPAQVASKILDKAV